MASRRFFSPLLRSSSRRSVSKSPFSIPISKLSSPSTSSVRRASPYGYLLTRAAEYATFGPAASLISRNPSDEDCKERLGGLNELKETLKRMNKKTTTPTNEGYDRNLLSEARIQREKNVPVDDRNEITTGEGGVGNLPSQSTSSSSKVSKRKAPSKNSAIHEDMQEVASSLKEIARAIMGINRINRRVWSEEKMFEELKKLGLEGSLLLDAMDWLVEHPHLVGTFFACLEELRMKWLQRKMKP